MSEVHWANAKYWEQELLRAMDRLFDAHPHLLPFVFDKSVPQLRLPPEELLARARQFSSGELLLVRVVIELWNQHALPGCGVCLSELIHGLDGRNYQNVLAALGRLGSKTSSQCKTSDPDPAWGDVLF